MNVLAVREAHELCDSFLEACGARGSEIESFLTQYLLIAAYATFEGEINSIVRERSERVKDPEAANYLRVTVSNVIRGLKVGDLAGYVGRFSEQAKSDFSGAVTNTVAHAAWDSLLNDRHASAHGEGAKLSIGDFREAFESGLVVLVEFAAALGVARTFPPSTWAA